MVFVLVRLSVLERNAVQMVVEEVVAVAIPGIVVSVVHV
jgi:hypothetical protein